MMPLRGAFYNLFIFILILKGITTLKNILTDNSISWACKNLSA